MKRASLIMFGALLFVCVCGCERRSYLARGEAALDAGNYQEAEILFRKELQQRPRSVEAHYDLGRVLLQEGDYTLGWAEFGRTLDLDPGYAPAEIIRAHLMLMRGERHEAEDIARAVLKTHPTSLDARILLGDTLGSQDKLEDARSQFQMAIDDHPERAAGHYGMAQIALRSDQNARALTELDRAIAAEPKQIDAYLLKAECLSAQHKAHDTVTILRSAIAARPDSTAAKIALGDALLDAGARNEALSQWRAVAKGRADAELAASRLVLTELATGQISDAAHDMDLVKSPVVRQDSDFLYAQARLLYAQGRYQDAIPFLLELTQSRDHFAPGFYYLGSCELAVGKTQDARRALETATALAPDFDDARILLARIEVDQGDPAAAVDNLDSVLKRNDAVSAAHLTKGDAFFALQNYSGSNQEYRRALALSPDLAIAHQRLGRLATVNGEYSAAISEFEKALALQPSSLDALEQLIAALRKTKGSQAALDRLAAQVKRLPTNAYLLALYGDYLEAEGQHARAINELQSAVAYSPTLFAVYPTMAEAYANEGKYTEAATKLAFALRQQPNYIPALMALGAIARQQGDRERSIQCYRKILELNPNSASAANAVAWEYALEKAHLDEALDLAQRARRLSPKNPHIGDTLGFVLLQRGLPQQALPFLQESAAALPDSPVVQHHLELTLTALNQAGAAKTEPHWEAEPVAESADPQSIPPGALRRRSEPATR
jgi:tetratricopeptide (TPR) repeat protein